MTTGRDAFEAHYRACEQCRSIDAGLCEAGVALLLAAVREFNPELGEGTRIVLGIRLEHGVEPEEARRQFREAGQILEGACALAARSGVQSGVFLAALAKCFGAGLGHYEQERARGQVDVDVFQTELIRWFQAVATEAVHHLRCQSEGGEGHQPETHH